MRLRDIQKILNDHKDGINAIKFGKPNSLNVIEVSGYDRVYKAMLNLKKIPALRPAIESLINSDIGKNAVGSIGYKPEQVNQLNKNLSNVKIGIKILDTLLLELVEKQTELTLCIKLYEFKNFQEFSQFCSDFNKKILSPIGKLNDEVYLSQLETGSKWINICLGSLLSVSLLTSIFRVSFDILIHDYQHFRVVNELIEKYEDQNNQMSEFNKFIEEEQKKIYFEKSESIIETIKNDDKLSTEDKTKFLDLKEQELNELKIAISKSIEESTKQIEKGLEITQALDIPESKRYALPDYTALLYKNKQNPKKITKNK